MSNAKQKNTTNTLVCVRCATPKAKQANFYNTDNPMYEKIGKLPICKKCISEMINYDDINSIYRILQQFDIMFDYEYWDVAKEAKVDTFGKYMTMANSMHQFKGMGWRDSVFVESEKPEIKVEVNEVSSNDISNFEEETIEDESVIESINRDRSDVIRMLGHDPFEYEHENDKKQLYSKLIDFLDESALEDGFKLQACIEIVKGFNQVDKINQAITSITGNPDNLVVNTGNIKQLADVKKNILASVMKLAEENGISVKHNNQKSKGAGTLSGIIKTLQEKGIEEGSVNLFDIETAKGMRQVADLSNQSIVAQLQFDENDYTAMILEQREIIQDLDSKVIKLEEENRMLKKEVIKYSTEDVGDTDV